MAKDFLEFAEAFVSDLEKYPRNFPVSQLTEVKAAAVTLLTNPKITASVTNPEKIKTGKERKEESLSESQRCKEKETVGALISL